MNKREQQILALGARDTARIEFRERVQAKRDRHGNGRSWNFQAPKRSTK